MPGAGLLRHPRVEMDAEDGRKRIGSNRQDVSKTANDEGATVVDELQFLTLEHDAVLIAQNRNQQLVGQLVLDGMPFDVEEPREPGAWAVLEDVLPPWIRRRGDPHVVRYQIEYVPHAASGEGINPPPVVRIGADLGIEFRRVGDVVAMQTSGNRGQVRRGIAVADSERLQIIDDVRRVAEREQPVELKAIGRRGDSDGRHAGAALQPERQSYLSRARSDELAAYLLAFY